MFPYKDDNPTLARPVVTWAIIAANIAVWVLIQGMGADPLMTASVCELALIPGELLQTLPPGTVVPVSPDVGCRLGAPNWLTPVSSMFMHGGWMHLIGNMWFLWVFGNNVEDSQGHVRFAVFYLLCGLAAAAAQVVVNPSSPIPMLGASGAVGGVMGAYVVLYPRVRVHMIVFLGIFITRIAVPAFLMLGYWFLLQLLGGWSAVGSDRGGVAFWAHVGGFAAGALLILVFQDRALVAEHRARSRYVDGLGYRERF
jgi:membrane associated rhomboid family serine protease